MLVDFIRWLLGYVTFSFSGGFADDFVNSCFVENIRIYNITQKGKILFGKCSPNEYKKLHRIAYANGGVVKIEKRHGLIFPLVALRQRMGLVAGIVAFFLIMGFLEGFVWNVQVSGNEKIPTEQITAFLQDNGFHSGTYRKSVDKNALEDLMMASFDNMAWVHINYQGSNAVVEVREATPKPEMSKHKGFANLKSSKDGIIVEAMTYDGWAVLGTGDSVSKGDLLVSGVYQGEKTNLYAYASGRYIAQVQENFSLVVNREQCRKVYTGKKQYKAIRFFGLYLPLYLGSVSKMQADVDKKTDYLKINSIDIPIGITSLSARTYKIETRILSDRELNALTEKRIKHSLNNSYEEKDIISKNIEVSLNRDNASAKGTVTVLENIGMEVPLKITKEKK